MANTIWKEVFLIMCSSSEENARNTERFPQSLRITDDYALQTLCCSPHNVCDDEGKISGKALNRAIYNEDGEMVDIIAGTFFICDCSGENLGSLSKEQLERYGAQFHYPENFIRINDEIKALKYKPETSRDER